MANTALTSRLTAYAELMRLNRPIGTYLLLWPALWGLWSAAQGLPTFTLLLVFVFGVVLMRSAGCVINDFADRHWDGEVARTQNRPLAKGTVSSTEALRLFMAIIALAACLLFFLPWKAIYVAPIALLLASIYPFMKRYTHLPQFFLGAAFACSIPMAWLAIEGTLSTQAGLLYMSTLLWTMAYDTQYAMVDREDDLRVGIKSTAILFGHADYWVIALLQAMSLLGLVFFGIQAERGWLFFSGLLLAAGLFAWQFRWTQSRQPALCFKAFLHNNWVGMAIFVAMALDYGV